MSSLVNQVQLIGHLGSDAVIKTTAQGVQVSTFSVATNEMGKSISGERNEATLWHQCVVWGDLNKRIEKYGKKGAQVMIQGSLNYRSYEDTKGLTKHLTEVRVHNFLVLVFAKSKDYIEHENDDKLPI
ncbi:single-stranded DNA-binding protein [Sphingobacterium rhinopitheci]|uniref:single-stranded DNA-binding protein n=1 Tax=Sphingobacterium rhinopitheci TaxID=2781960 RepID=UPI001F52073B|nr:single-stranded DNA-binding protein [Sphingobacterium rhinopitheci]MCI0922285.1 single-stranded DNA-binding protein [Sphingobacterium rhinopitheci]